jgi:hypothetical protein
MPNDETPKIEPTLVLRDAPSIAADAPKPEAAVEPGEVAVVEAPKAESPAPDAAKVKVDAEVTPAQPEPSKTEAPTLPRAPQLGNAKALVPFKTPASSTESAVPQPRSTRFALLAASVAIAASFGAVAGSLGVAKLGPAFNGTPVAVAPAKEHVADEVKALKDSVAQLRATTKSLSDNLAALKTTVASSGAQSNKIAETLDRLEKGQIEQRKVSTTQAAAPETTGSVAQKPQQAAVPMVLGDPPTTLKPPIVQGWVLRRVYDGAALIEGRDGVIEVEPGIVAPGLGRIEGIKRQDGRWVVVTSRGLVVGR